MSVLAAVVFGGDRTSRYGLERVGVTVGRATASGAPIRAAGDPHPVRHETEILRALLAAQGHEGALPACTVATGGAALGACSARWDAEHTHPGPIVDSERGLILLFDGRLDDVGALRRALGSEAIEATLRATRLPSGSPSSLVSGAGRPAIEVPPDERAGYAASDWTEPTDAHVVLAAWRRWGVSTPDRLEGPYALVVLDRVAGRVHLARDAMGGRGLCWRFEDGYLLVASEAGALAASGSRPRLDERSVAHLFALQVPESGATIWSGVREVRSGEALRFPLNGGTAAMRRPQSRVTWRPDWAALAAQRAATCATDAASADAAWAGRFLRALDNAVRMRLPPDGGAGVLLSGGLDSSAVAALAAESIAPQRLKTFSYVFDELRSCDERRWIGQMAQRWHLQSTYLPADGDWPLRHMAAWPTMMSGPEDTPYRWAIERAYGAARARGVRVLMPGAFADHLYAGAEEWLADLVSDGRWIEALRELVRHVVRAPGGPMQGARGLMRGRSVRRLLARWVGRSPRLPIRCAPAWLTPEAASMIDGGSVWPPWAGEAPRPGQAVGVFGVMPARAVDLSRQAARRSGIDLRHPFRDRRLATLMLSMPAHQLYNRGRAKDVQRRALGTRLPTIVRERGQPNDLSPLYRRGVAEREARRFDALLDRRDALWRGVVREDWLEAHRPRDGRTPGNGPAQAAVWRAALTELWRERHVTDGSG